MIRSRLLWPLAVPAWLAAALGVLALGATAESTERCPLDGPWG